MSWYDLCRFSHIAERLPQHCECRNTSSKWMNVAIMLCRCFLATFSANVVATLLKLSWNMLQQLNLPTFSYFPPTLWKRCCNHILLGVSCFHSASCKCWQRSQKFVVWILSYGVVNFEENWSWSDYWDSKMVNFLIKCWSIYEDRWFFNLEFF